MFWDYNIITSSTPSLSSLKTILYTPPYSFKFMAAFEPDIYICLYAHNMHWDNTLPLRQPTQSYMFTSFSFEVRSAPFYLPPGPVEKP